MKKKRTILTELNRNLKSKATNAAKQTVYVALFNELPPKEKRKA